MRAMSLRIGILGAANIAGPFMIGAKASSRATVVAVASRARARGEAFAHTHAIPRVCSYHELIETDYHNHTERVTAPSYRIKRSTDWQASSRPSRCRARTAFASRSTRSPTSSSATTARPLWPGAQRAWTTHGRWPRCSPAPADRDACQGVQTGE